MREQELQQLLNWGASNARAYPWRKTTDPYVIAVAEILLQKTKARDVLPVWSALTRRYPTAEKLAVARRDSLSGIVSGLGLGRQRTSRLIQMAADVAAGVEWQSVRGLGPYAKGVMALNTGIPLRTAPIDGNIARVVQRFTGSEFAKGEPRRKTEIKRAIERWLQAQDATETRLALVYSLVDLGHAVCTPRKPDCSACPLALGCASSVPSPS